MLREAGALTTQVTGEVIASDRPRSTAMAIRQPVGVVLGIAPWNAPIILAVRVSGWCCPVRSASPEGEIGGVNTASQVNITSTRASAPPQRSDTAGITSVAGGRIGAMDFCSTP